MNAALNQPATHPASNTGKAAIKKRIVPSAFAQQVAGGDVITPSGLSESFAIFTFLGLWLRRWMRLTFSNHTFCEGHIEYYYYSHM